MERDELVLTEVVAQSLIRTLAGAPGYPFHVEGEARVAHVLMECALSVEHARAVVEEFEADFPTMEQIRSVAYRLRSKFDPAAKVAETEKRKHETEDRAALKGLRDSVPLIAGVRWEICLQIQCLRIAIQEGYKDQAYYLQCVKEFPEAMALIRAGQDPDPVVVEKQYRVLHPMWRPGGMQAMKMLDAIVGGAVERVQESAAE